MSSCDQNERSGKISQRRASCVLSSYSHYHYLAAHPDRHVMQEPESKEEKTISKERERKSNGEKEAHN